MNETNQNPNDAREPEIIRNEIGNAADPTVVVDEADRTVVLTDKETIILEKAPHIDIPAKNRPRKVYLGMWGPVEIGVAGAGMLAIIGAVLMYVFFVAPSARELENNRARRDKIEAELASANEKYGNISKTETRVSELISSVNDFESLYLPVPTTGRTALYQRLNGLIVSYGLINSAGPDYTPLEILDKNKENKGQEGGKSKFRNFFPGVYVTMTLEGPYTNLRRFIRELETGNEFIVVTAVELEPSDSEEKKDQTDAVQTGEFQSGFDLTTTRPGIANTSEQIQGQAASPNASRGKTRGSMVSLRLEMAAYFRRPNAEQTLPETQAQ